MLLGTLSLLFSATGINDPRRGSALGSYEYAEGPWQVWGGRTGESPSGGIGFASKRSSLGGKINPDAQKELIKAWVEWLQTVEVKDGDEE